MHRAGPRGEMIAETEAEWKAFFAKPQYVHYVCMALRPGSAEFSADLERRYYPAGTLLNIHLHLRILKWEDIPWFITSIPNSDTDKAAIAATANGLKIVDGIPTALSSQGTVQFPIRGSNVFTLENIAGHPIYKRGPSRT